MNLNTVKDFAWQTGKNTLGIMAVNMAGLPQQMKNIVPDMKGVSYAINGATYGIAVDAVRAVEGRSKLLNQQWISMLDDVGFFSAFSAGIDMSGVDKIAFGAINGYSPLGSEMNINLTEGTLVSSGLAVANLMDQTTGSNQVFDFIRRPVSESIKLVTR